MITLNISWLHGKFECGEINTSLGTVEVYSEEFFAQGDDAFGVIEEIRSIWINSDVSVEQAFSSWISLNF
ncbi:MAG: hypothetical protein WCW62_06975 [Bacteroidales bacterium]|jgi:hypothetical protein